MAILGSGFGLYGYLPGLSGSRVVLPRRYESIFEARSDVGRFGDCVDWVDDEVAALNLADAVVVAQRPSDQVRWIDEILTRPNIKAVLLEKPLAPDPAQSTALLGRLKGAKRRVRIGYTLRYTDWGRGLLATLSAPGCADVGEIRINWRFRAHHYASGRCNWKRTTTAGGGALRFYGIHLIALLAEAGYDDARASTTWARIAGEAETWDAVVTGPGLPPCVINVESNASPSAFSVKSAVGAVVEIRDPFDDVKTTAGLDRRVDITARICRELLDPHCTTPLWYEGATALWQAIELRNYASCSPTLSQPTYS